MSGDRPPGPPTLVKVGSGSFMPWHGVSLLDLDCTQLLLALKAVYFLAQDTLVGDCKVYVLKPAKDKPLPVGLLSATAVALEFDATIKSLLDTWGPDIPRAKLFIRVETPAPPAGTPGAGSQTGITAELMLCLPQSSLAWLNRGGRFRKPAAASLLLIATQLMEKHLSEKVAIGVHWILAVVALLFLLVPSLRELWPQYRVSFITLILIVILLATAAFMTIKW